MMNTLALVVGVGLTLTTAVSGSSAQDFQSGLYPLLSAYRFLDAAYPELRAQAAGIRLIADVPPPQSPWLRFFEFRVADSQSDLQRRGRTEDAEAFFVARFDIRGNTLVSFGSHGRYVEDPANRLFCQALEEHPRWSDDQISKELARRGAQFGPGAGDAVADRVLSGPLVAQLAGVEPLNIRSIDFAREGARVSVGCVSWEVWYGAASGREDISYVAQFEPFAGRLVLFAGLVPTALRDTSSIPSALTTMR